MQYEDRSLDATRVLGRTLLSGQENPDQAASLSVLQDDRPVQDLGIYGQEEVLLFDRRLLLTAGVRADKSNTNGDPNKFFLYPKAALSYRFIRPFNGLDEIKLRGAYGQTGNQPLFGAKFSPDTTGTIGGIFGTLPGNRAGDPFIKPERQTELEGGFDAQLAGGRAELNFTVYQRNISDLLLEQTLPPSSGQEFRIFSSDSKLRNRGLEAALTVSPIQSPGRELAVPDHLLQEQQRDHPAVGADVPDRRLRPVAGHLPDRGGQLGHPDLRDRGQGGRRHPGLPDVASPATSTSSGSLWASCWTGSRAATSST